MTFWLLETFAAISFLIVAVLLLRRPVARMFGAGWAYALWLIPALRLILPPLPQLSEALPPVVIFIPATGGAASLPAQAGSGQWMPLLLATWAGGAVIFLVLQWLAYRAFVRRLDLSSRPARPPLYGGIATFVSEAVDGPLAVGLVKPRIVVPADFSRRYGPSERRLAMEHELTHHRRGDLWWNVAAILVLALNWFNPLAWIAFLAFRTDQELACDAAVAARASAEERLDYALALVKSAARPGLIAACSMNGAGELKRRLRMMRSHRTSRLRSAGGGAALSLLAVGGLSLAAVTQAPRQPIVYVPPPHAAAVQVASASPAAASAAQPIIVAATRAQLARATAPTTRSAAAPRVGARPRLTLARVEPKLAPLTLQPMRLPRLRILPVLVAASAEHTGIVHVSATHTRTFVIRASLDATTREQVRAALEEAILRTEDAETRIRLQRVEDVLGGAYIATIVQDTNHGE
jgi:beta-lactamase regulating signal transducer with metallopeptidase domain